MENLLFLLLQQEFGQKVEARGEVGVIRKELHS